MTFAGSSPSGRPAAAGTNRLLEPAEWTAIGAPLLRSPRHFVADLTERHGAQAGSAVVAVHGAAAGDDGRLLASASFPHPAGRWDGWDLRNAVLQALRRVIPHDLRRRRPVRTAHLLLCRDGDAGWTPLDGAWMWGLRDACSLHGLRCGAFVTLTPHGWKVQGEARRGRTPHVTFATDPAPARGDTAAGRRPPVPAPRSAPREVAAR